MKFWPKLKRSGAKIESVSSDMSAAFISAIKKNQTDTIHVFDHFHVQKLAGEALDKVRRDVYNQEKDLEKRKVLKRNAYVYRDIAYLKLRLFNLHNDKITRFVG